MADVDPTTARPEDAAALPARLVFSLMQAAVRVAARVHMPLKQLQELVRTAYFLEHRRNHPRDLVSVADKLDVSLRTAGTLNKQLRDAFFRPEREVEPIRSVTTALLGGPLSRAGLEEETELEGPELERALTHLGELGWIDIGDDGVVRLSRTLRSWVADDLEKRVDGINHQLSVIAEGVWSRFVRHDTATSGGRTWTFAVREEDLGPLVDRVIAVLRAEAVAAEEAAMADDGGGTRVGMTVAIAPMRPAPVEET